MRCLRRLEYRSLCSNGNVCNYLAFLYAFSIRFRPHLDVGLSANRNSHTHTSILMRDDGTHLCESLTAHQGGLHYCRVACSNETLSLTGSERRWCGSVCFHRNSAPRTLLRSSGGGGSG